MGESRRGAEAMRPAHLHHAPQPRGVALARDDEQLAAARQEARQARERLVDVVLRDARLVEPDLGRPPLCSNDAAHPLSAANLRPGATSSSAHACDMNASTWPSSAFVDRAASNGRGCGREQRPWVSRVLEAAAADVAAVDDADTSAESEDFRSSGSSEPTGMARNRLVARASTAAGVCPPHRLATAAARCSSVSPCLPSAPRRRTSAPRRRSVGRMADATKMTVRTR